LVDKVSIELSTAAAMIDRLAECWRPSMELMEVSRSIHAALVAVGTLEASMKDGPPSSGPVPVLARRYEDGRRSGAGRPPPGDGSSLVSILYDDLLVPMDVPATSLRPGEQSAGSAN